MTADIEYPFSLLAGRGQDIERETAADAWLLLATPTDSIAGFEEYGSPVHQLENTPGSFTEDVFMRFAFLNSLALHASLSTPDRAIYADWNALKVEGETVRIEYIRGNQTARSEVIL